MRKKLRRLHTPRGQYLWRVFIHKDTKHLILKIWGVAGKLTTIDLGDSQYIDLFIYSITPATVRSFIEKHDL